MTKGLVALLILFILSFNPSLSQAQPQALQNEQSMTNNNSVEEKQVVAKIGSQISVVVLGDSLSAAYGIQSQQGWVELLAKKRPNLQINNASISGETTSGGKQRLPALLNKYKPSILVLELGANDALRGQNLKVTQANLQQMISLCSSFNTGCQVILLGVQLPTNYGPAYDQMFQKMYRDLAKSNQLIFDPFFLEEVALDPDLMQWDGLHPNAKAQPYIVKRVTPLFEQAILKLKE